MMLRLPPDQKTWLENEARRHWMSQNAMVVRAIRQAMEAEQEKAAR